VEGFTAERKVSFGCSSEAFFQKGGGQMKQPSAVSALAKVTGFVIVVAIIAAIGGLLFGYDIGTLTVISLMIYIAAFAIRIRPVFWLLISEIYPLNVRGTAMSLATVANWTANFLVAVTFLSFVKVLTVGGTFLFYATVGVFAWIFTYRLVPETKGKTLEEIQKHWQTGKHPREMGKQAVPPAPPAPVLGEIADQ
jgi:SP family galactose:H+ symporter-like MFS transporter